VSGGRVLCVAGVGATAAEARARAYAAVPSSRFEGALVRSDIGASTV
jgi:phosphoribosylamine-glycine ligase